MGSSWTPDRVTQGRHFPQRHLLCGRGCGPGARSQWPLWDGHRLSHRPRRFPSLHFGDLSGAVQPLELMVPGLWRAPRPAELWRAAEVAPLATRPAGQRLTSWPHLLSFGPGSFRHGRLCLQTLHQPLREPGEPGPLQHLEPGPRVSASLRTRTHPTACCALPCPARGLHLPSRAQGSGTHRRRRRAVWKGLPGARCSCCSPTGRGVIQRRGPRRALARSCARL